MQSAGCNSPLTGDAPLEYLTVESYWPKPEPSKRALLDEDEKRRRHIESQKRSLARKRWFVKQLARDHIKLELQLKLLVLLQESKALQVIQNGLLLRVSGLYVFETTDSVCRADQRELNELEGDTGFVASAVESLNVDELIAELGLF